MDAAGQTRPAVDDLDALLDRRPKDAEELAAAMRACVQPKGAYLGCGEVLAALAAGPGARLPELASLPLGAAAHRLVALRYFLANGPTWIRYHAWEAPLARVDREAPARVLDLADAIARARAESRDAAALASLGLEELGRRLDEDRLLSREGLALLVALHEDAALVASVRERLRVAAVEGAISPRAADLLYLATHPLDQLPATTVGSGELRYVIVADKGEMGVRAVREAMAFGATPVVVYSEQDDAGALQVRVAEGCGGFTVALSGGFRESYANAAQIVARVRAAFEERFGDKAEQELACAAVYPGYGPLAENTAAIQCFRRAGLVFVGPTQSSVERAGDKRKFRALAEAIDPSAVTPGLVLDTSHADAIEAAIRDAHASGAIRFPGRLKAANGGGGRGQVVVRDLDALTAATRAVLGQIASNGWDAGVMFEENIPETVHLEVQVVRDRYGNARHFGMRDCTEQRASQKIQEEAPPALLRTRPELTERCTSIAVAIADAVDYVGACTVELMYKDGRFFLLEMNTRIQVEHPVSEEAHRIRRGDALEPLNLVQLQLAVAAGRAIDFAQEDVVATHVARELRINAESYRADVKDPRDGKRGLFLPNAGVFDTIEVPSGEDVLERLVADGVSGLVDLRVRFDVGFEPGDVLVNKDPTFGKLIVAVQTDEAHHEQRYELLRRAAIEVVRHTHIEGRQVKPDGGVLDGYPFETNLSAHLLLLETDMLVEHGLREARGRHVGWVLEHLRGER